MLAARDMMSSYRFTALTDCFKAKLRRYPRDHCAARAMRTRATSSDVAELLSAELGRTIRHVDLPAAEDEQVAIASGVPAWLATDIVNIYSKRLLRHGQGRPRDRHGPRPARPGAAFLPPVRPRPRRAPGP